MGYPQLEGSVGVVLVEGALAGGVLPGVSKNEAEY